MCNKVGYSSFLQFLLDPNTSSVIQFRLPDSSLSSECCPIRSEWELPSLPLASENFPRRPFMTDFQMCHLDLRGFLRFPIYNPGCEPEKLQYILLRAGKRNSAAALAGLTFFWRILSSTEYLSTMVQLIYPISIRKCCGLFTENNWYSTQCGNTATTHHILPWTVLVML